MPKGVRKLAIANAVYIVDRDKYGKRISSKEFRSRIKEIEHLFLKFFGGVSHDEIDHGEFLSKTQNKILTEKVARIVSFAETRSFKKHRLELQKWLLKKKKEWNQEAIAYEFEGDLYYL
jgi:predicted secreted Zn-dependent protease